MKNTLMLIALTLGLNTFAAPSLWTDAKDKTLPADFKVQGEYLGELSCGCDVGAQVIALGGGEFQMVIYPGGLPGLFAEGVADLSIDALEVQRPDPLPQGWSATPVTQMRAAG